MKFYTLPLCTYPSLAGILLNVYLHCARECAKWVERRTKNKSPPILAVDERLENKWVRSYVSTKGKMSHKEQFELC